MVTAGRYPSLQVRFSIDGDPNEAVALVDTGCDVHLVVPQSLIATLPPPIRERRMRTVSDEIVTVPLYLGLIQIREVDGSMWGLIVALGTEYLLGLPLLNHYRVTFDHGQRVIIDPSPSVADRTVRADSPPSSGERVPSRR